MKIKILLLISLSFLLVSSIFSQVLYVKKHSSGSIDGTSWQSAFANIQDAINKANEISAKEIWVAKGTYYEKIILKNSIKLYGGFRGDENYREERNIRKNEVVIDGQKRGRCVLCAQNTLVDGFTIQNGKLDTLGNVKDRAGAGILLFKVNGTIRNNVIKNNEAGWGAGIFVEGSGNVLIEDNLIMDNKGIVCAGGIEVTQFSGKTIVRHNTIVDNIGFGLEIPAKEGLILGDFHSNIICYNKFNHHIRFSKRPKCLDVWGFARACTDFSYVEDIWESDEKWGSPFNHRTNIYGNYDNIAPGFLNYNGKDFRLRVDSPCVGTGKPNGNGHLTNMGAFGVASANSNFISGFTTYYSKNEPISDVKLIITAQPDKEIFSRGDGFYKIDGVPSDSFIVIPNKPKGQDIEETAITSYDAALIAQHALDIIDLDNFQRLAADCNKDEIIDFYDASLVARYAVGLTLPSDSHVAEWLFDPSFRYYGNVSSNITNQNYNGIIIGNVHRKTLTKNMEKSKKQFDRKQLMVYYKNEDNFVIEFNTPPLSNIIAIDCAFLYDSTTIKLDNYKLLNNTESIKVMLNDEMGLLRVGIIAPIPLHDEEKILKIVFRSISGRNKLIPVKLSNYLINGELVYKEVFTHKRSFLSKDKEKSSLNVANFPNPFNSFTLIKYSIIQEGHLSMNIYNLFGQKVKCLVNGYHMKGSYSTRWDGKDDSGRLVGSGIYFLHIKANAQECTKKILLTK